MFNHVHSKAKENPLVKCVRLYVDTTNARAMDVYKKMGMYDIGDSFDFHEKDFVF